MMTAVNPCRFHHTGIASTRQTRLMPLSAAWDFPSPSYSTSVVPRSLSASQHQPFYGIKTSLNVPSHAHFSQFDVPNAIGCTLMHYVAGEDATGGCHLHICRRIFVLRNANASDIMQWLLDVKGDPCALNMDRMSPLACAVFKDCARNAELLLLAQPSTLKVHDANGDLPLHLALLEGSSTALQALLKHGADWFDCNERGETSFDLYKTVVQAGDEQGKLQRLVEVMQLLILLAINACESI